MPAEGAVDVDRGARLRVTYDRPLDPSSVGRGQVALHSGPAQPFLEVRLDPIRDTIVARPFGGASLGALVLYRLEIDGVRDLDGREVEPLTLLFETGSTATVPPPEGLTPWEAVGALFATHCVEGCHDGSRRDANLDLSSLGATQSTAVGVPALQATDTLVGGLGGLDVIEPGDPSRSYLVYKMLGDPHVWGDPMPPAGPLPKDEVAIVADWILGGAR